MTDPRALPPGCSPCRTRGCDDGWITVELTGPASSASIEPVVVATRREACPDCDGRGHADRRERERDSHSDLYQAFVALRNALSIAQLDAEELRFVNDRLLAENRAQRVVIQHQARLLDRADFKHTKGDRSCETESTTRPS